MPARRSLAALLAACLSAPPSSAGEPFVFRPKLVPSEALAPFLPQLRAGHDQFTDEVPAEALEARLAELGERLRADVRRADAAVSTLLAPEFRGARFELPARPKSADRQALEVVRATQLAGLPELDARAFATSFQAWLVDFRTVDVAEFLLTAIEVGEGGTEATSEVRYDLVGAGTAAARVELVGRWRLRWLRSDAGWRATEWIEIEQQASRAATPIFSEATAAALGADEAFRRQLTAPLDAWLATIDSVLSRDSIGHHGVSVGDADGDGREDLYVAQPAGLPNRLFRARGDGTFEDATERAGLGVLDDTSQSLFADLDNDGDQDLVLATGTGPLLFVNDGTGRFANVPNAFQLAESLRGTLTAIAIADYDRDGFLDLYLCTYLYFMGASLDKAGPPTPYHDARNGPPDVLLRNDGHGRFVDVTQATGLGRDNDRFGLAAAWGDYDDDGWPDLLVANDFGVKNLFHNLGRQNGQVKFEDVAQAAGVEDHGAGMSAAWVDYDNDGRLDIYTGNMWSAPGLRVTAEPQFKPEAPEHVRALYRRHARGNALFRNLGNGRFEDVTVAARAEFGRWAWSSDALDFDSDGFEDLYVANGMITRAGDLDLDSFFWRQLVARSPLGLVTGTPYDDTWRVINRFVADHSWASRQRNVMLHNDGQGGFDDVSGTTGLDLDQDGRSFGVLDYDGDGDPDLALMAARSAPQLRLFRNDFTGAHAALAVRLVGRTQAGSDFASNRDAVGARVTVETERLRRTKLVTAGSGFISQHSKELLFGLGASERVRSVTVAWPSGRTQSFSDLAVNQRLTLTEGAEPRAVALGPVTAMPPAPQLEPAQLPAASWLYEPFPAPDFELPDLQGQRRSLRELRGRPALLLFWAAEDEASLSALRTLEQGAGTLARAGVGVLAVALDEARALEKVRAAASATSRLPVLLATESAANSYAILNRHLFVDRQDLRLPTALLLDAQGRIVKVYRDRLETAALLADVPKIEATPEQRLARSIPFGGRFFTPQAQRGYLSYGRELLEQGLSGPALAAFELAARGNPSASTLYRLGTLFVKGGQLGPARQTFERCLALDPAQSEASNDLGALLAQAGDLPAAIERFEAALRTTPDYPDALNNLGYARLLAGQAAEAQRLYEKALALQPDFPEALNNLGLIHGRAGDLARAEPYFRQALERRPDYGEAANNLALVLVGRRDQDGAFRLLTAFLEAYPAYEGTYLTLAKLCLNMEKPLEARQFLQLLLRRNPAHPLAQELLRSLP